MSYDPTKPFTFIIFGASGDLTQRKLIPALYNLYKKERLPQNFQVIGFARRPYSTEKFHQILLDGLKKFSGNTYDNQLWSQFAPKIKYFQGNLTQVGDFVKLENLLNDIEDRSANRLYYLATAPSLYFPVIDHLGTANMVNSDGSWRHIVIEKPFGHDLESAQELNEAVHAVFDEHQVYRIDHYLGKETAQNVLFFRFANTIFEPVWNRNYIDNVQITAVEQVDVGHRAGYYDQAGVLRDMFQNHLLQLFTLVAMEAPASFNADARRDEKVKILSAVRPIAIADTVRAQYDGYCGTEGVGKNSQTPTYAALKLNVDNWRWKDVPFYLRSGKALKDKYSQIVVQFKEPPHLMFPIPDSYHITSNTISICVQPDEGIHLRFEAKVPDTIADMRSVIMDFHYGESFGATAIPDAYERLLLDAIQGDASLFTRSDGIESAWKLIDPILEGWKSPRAPELASYAKGSLGPKEANELLERDGRHWAQGCMTH